jgi:hypothetical protein
MSNLSINDLENNLSREIIELSEKQQEKTIGGGEEETTILFIGLKPSRKDLTVFLGPPIPSL